jgi:hypothetical protein
MTEKANAVYKKSWEILQLWQVVNTIDAKYQHNLAIKVLVLVHFGKLNNFIQFYVYIQNIIILKWKLNVYLSVSRTI